MEPTPSQLFNDEQVSDTSWVAAHLQAPGQQWPRRLLDVSSMTSLERRTTSGTTRYGPHTTPPYNILTYTWGRWEHEQGEAIAIGNITWDVPRIHASHFSRQQLQTTLYRVAGYGSCVWIDIACIDQNNQSIKMDEIGRQAAIFEKADQVFVWLTTHRALDLQQLLDTLAESQQFCENVPYHQGLQSEDNLEAWADRTHNACSRLLSDPWFSSLWTLQESYLRHDAVILCQEATSVQWSLSQFKRKALLKDLIRCFYTILSRWEQLMAERIIPGSKLDLQAQDLVERLLESGFPSLHDDNPVSVYGAACFRRPLETLDRVEGIQQIFGLNVMSGTARTLNELQNQLAIELNLISPLYAQMFVHTASAPEGLSWRLSQYARVPEEARWANGRYMAALRGKAPAENLCHIYQERGQIKFTGFSASFRDLNAFWQRQSLGLYGRDSLFADSLVPARLIQSIYIDSSTLLPSSLRQPFLNNMSKIERLQLCNGLDGHFGNALLVALLGKHNFQVQGLSQGTGEIWAGLLLLEVAGKWARVGIVMWERTSPVSQMPLWGKMTIDLA